jgi:nitrogen fixation NifU-like protein
MDIEVEGDVIKNIGWEGLGCAISQASASLLTSHFVGKTIAEAREFGAQDLLTLLGIELTPTRMKCALLSLETLNKAIAKQ